jgi:hypothetical protein
VPISSSNNSIGSSTPRMVHGPSERVSSCSATSRCVAALIITLPGAASFSSREAMWMVVPSAR